MICSTDDLYKSQKDDNASGSPGKKKEVGSRLKLLDDTPIEPRGMELEFTAYANEPVQISSETGSKLGDGDQLKDLQIPDAPKIINPRDLSDSNITKVKDVKDEKRLRNPLIIQDDIINAI